MIDDADAVHPGDILAGKYRVERILGRGGMGVVVKAVALEGDQPCAVKLLPRAALSHPTAVERFLRESRATSRLTSEHVVRVIDVGELRSGAPYMAMEHLEGADLGSILKRRGALPTHEAARHVIQACRALAEAHAAGIVHRDLKPANLFLTRRPNGSTCIKVLDFGISKALTARDEVDLTLSNTVLGSPSYMSPEQIRSARSVDARTDVWSLGVVLYQLVTGKLPFSSNNASEVVAMVARDTPKAPSELRPGLPRALDGVILRCLEKDAEARFASVTELAAALDPFVPASRAAASVPPPSDAHGAPRARRRPAIVALSALGAVVLAIAVLALILR